MPPKLPPASDALAAIADDLAEARTPPRAALALACRATCAELGERFGGRTIELRVPPFAAVQLHLGEGSTHTRGTPPNVVETDPETFCRLALGQLTWTDARPRLRVSGVHAEDVAEVFPLPTVG